MLLNLENDIPTDVARAAHYGTSFVPDKRAQQEQEEHARIMQADYDDLARHADTDEKLAQLDEEFSRYREGYRRRKLACLQSRARCMSSMITGPANFPTARNQKRNNVADKRMQELIDFRARALDAIRKTLRPELRPIMAGDVDAAERLQEKIDKAERMQSIMRDANKIIRRAPKNEPTPDKLAALVALGLSDSQADELFKPDFCGRVGFADYQLSNNNANIKRMRDRLTQVERNKTAETTERDGANARLEDCPTDNRVRLFFPGKPDADTRTRLKSSGFRWAPSIGCWQAYRNPRTLATAAEVAGFTDCVATSVGRCGCPVNAPEANPGKFPCPCGDHCTEPECAGSF